MNRVFTVYSKKNCVFCDRAKDLITRNGDIISEHCLDEDIPKNVFVSVYPYVRTLPFIKLEDQEIGGYEALVNFYK